MAWAMLAWPPLASLGTMQPSKARRPRTSGSAPSSLALSATARCARTRRAPVAHALTRRNAAWPPVVRPPRLLAVQRDHLRRGPRRARRRVNARDPRPEARREAIRVQHREHAPACVMRGAAPWHVQERVEPSALGLADLLHLDPPVGPADRRAPCAREERAQRMMRGALHARVVQVREVCRAAQILPLPHSHDQRLPPARLIAKTIRRITRARRWQAPLFRCDCPAFLASRLFTQPRPPPMAARLALAENRARRTAPASARRAGPV